MGKYKSLGNFFDRIFRNDLNANFNEVDADIKVQKARVDNLITGNPQPEEVMDLRTDTDGVIHGTAWDRFASDESKKTTKFQEIDDQLAEKALQSDLNLLQSTVIEKADTSYVDTQISNIGNASPKGTYATLTALQTAFPTGTTGIYVVTADGKWYYWNGTAWTAGGIYQSTAIGDKTVSTTKLDDTVRRNISNSSLFGEIKKSTQTTVSVANSNGGVSSNIFNTITVPVGSTGNGSHLMYRNYYDFDNFYYTKNRIYMLIETNIADFQGFSISLNTVQNGVTNANQGGNVLTEKIDPYHYLISIEYWLQVYGIEALMPYVRITNTTALTQELTLTVKDVFFSSQSLNDTTRSLNNEIMNKSLSDNDDRSINFLTNHNLGAEGWYNVELFNLVIVDVTTYDTSFTLADYYNDTVPLKAINMDTNEETNKICTSGKYLVDVKDLTILKAKTVTSYIDQSYITVDLTFSKKEMPLLNLSNKHQKLSFADYTKQEISNTPAVVEFKDGYWYAAYQNTIRKYNLDTLTYEAILTVPGVTSIESIMLLDNGNILIQIGDGKLFLSQNLGTPTLIKDFGTIKPHYIFGRTAYKNIVLLTEYSTTKPLDGNVWMSTDYGVTFNSIFNLGNYNPPNTNYHTHSAVYDPYEKIIWVCTGDGKDNQMYFYSLDMGATWYKVRDWGKCPTQATIIIPMRDCVLFVSDARTVGVVRYNRPLGGTKAGQEFQFDMALFIEEMWGKSGNTEVPIASLPTIDFKNNQAFFGYVLLANSASGSTTGNLKTGEVYRTNGYDFEVFYKHDTSVSAGIPQIYDDVSNNRIGVKYSGAGDGIAMAALTLDM